MSSVESYVVITTLLDNYSLMELL